MAQKRDMTTSKAATSKKQVPQPGRLHAIKRSAAAMTRPVRENKVWKFLRRTVLRSPFRGYFVQSFRELRQVTWPKRKVAWSLTASVIIFSVIFSVFTSLLDIGFSELAKKLFIK